MNTSICEASKEHINKYKMAHCIGVAEYMRERAEAYGLVPDEMYVLGLLHDIGYLGGREGHEQRGADLLGAMCLGELYNSAIKHHGDNLRELALCGYNEIFPELILLIEADMSVDARGYRVGFEGRVADIARRYGEDSAAYATVQDNIRFIKEYQSEHGIGKRFIKECQQRWNIKKPTKLYHKDKERNERD